MMERVSQNPSAGTLRGFMQACGDMTEITALPPTMRATIEAMPLPVRVRFIEAVEAMTSFGQLAAIAHHLERGDALAALHVAAAPSDIYQQQDALIRFAFAVGYLSRT